MRATLYIPHQTLQQVSTEGLSLSDPVTGLANVPEQVPLLLGCTANLVDILDSGPGFVAYSVFDSEEAINTIAMQELALVSGHSYSLNEEDEILRGAVLIITG